jgi:hypothetical protein
MTKIDSIIKDQEAFVKGSETTLLFLKLYKVNPEQFDLLFSEKVKEYYRWEECNDNLEYIWEFLDEIFNDWSYGYKQFILVSNGITYYIDFSKPKKKKDSIITCYARFVKWVDGWSF